MEFLFDIHPEAKKLIEKASSLLPSLIEGVVPMEKETTIPRTEDLFSEPVARGKLCFLTEGTLHLTFGEERPFCYTAGDLIGFEHAYGLIEGRIVGEFGVKAKVYELKSFLSAMSAPSKLPLWNEYIFSYLNGFLRAVGALAHGEKEFKPEIRLFQKGDVIIQQGTTGDVVYTLLKGHAEVLVDGVKVGEVFDDEIFGALAALTKTSRTATVVATTECMTIQLKTEKFLELVQKKPATILKMVEDMARAIVSLNTRVVELQQSKTTVFVKS